MQIYIHDVIYDIKEDETLYGMLGNGAGETQNMANFSIMFHLR